MRIQAFRIQVVAALSAVLGLLAQGCVSVPKRNPIPEELITDASIPGLPEARIWGDEPPEWSEAWFAVSREELLEAKSGIFGREHH